MNERKTEDIVREHFKNDVCCKKNKIILEEQTSENPLIAKLLKNASEYGKAGGKPDFIIQYKDNTNFLIVIECKAGIKNHISREGNNCVSYAVDGVKLYSGCLSKSFDVLSIAVSGTDRDNLKINHFLQLKGGGGRPESVFGGKLLSLKAYLEGYKKDDRKFKQDFSELLDYSKALNNALHGLKIKESQRSLLIAGALIALNDGAFNASYKIETDYKKLINNFLNAVSLQLKNADNRYIIEEVGISYSFLKTHTILSRDVSVLKNLIKEIDGKINSFIKNYKYFDALEQFYIEFLRYANNDKGLGIVLTPPHITELFCELANINKDSVVLDNCAGTGGFLISAMQKMVRDSKGDNVKESEIKREQIVGIELQDDIFTLLCSNMHIHGDGRSNLYKGSCFDGEIIKEVEKFKANAGFLNPPYKSDKKDREELEFVLNNLSLLEKGSKCIAIVPMSCALTEKGNRLVLKEKLLSMHTLEAVFSMPNELFFNSKIGVSTCIMVFIAKERHPVNYKTYFGYWKDDGFTKRKTNGRADYNNKWNSIKSEWLKNYKNRDEVIGHSVKKEVGAGDEWCVEAYMETDYSVLKKADFENAVREYLSFLLKYSENAGNVSIKSESGCSKTMDLNVGRWKKFRYKDIFNISRGRSNEEDYGNKSLMIGASQNENGSNGEFIEAKPYYEKQAITVGNGGNTGCGQTFFQSLPFNAKSTVNILDLKSRVLNPFIALFLVTLIRLEKYRFNFGRGWSLERMKEDVIKLPVTPLGGPDFQFMQDYIKTLPYSSSL
uniref:site-specific DNA-methyltransferase (adenine-specific) n=1 Tax=Candidatus Endomicrobium sp. MdMp-027 TaxID=1837116 RepID=A0A1C9ZUC1_9BACT|nr:modification methylase [Candidatus Endomicrobium sp. MdMp-027]